MIEQIKVIDIIVILKDWTEYVIENFQCITYHEDHIDIIGEWTYEFGKDEIEHIAVKDVRIIEHES